MTPTTNPNDAPPFTPEMIGKLVEVELWRRPTKQDREYAAAYSWKTADSEIVETRVGLFGDGFRFTRAPYKDRVDAHWEVQYNHWGGSHGVNYSTHYLEARIVEPAPPAPTPRPRARIRGSRPVST